jgi:hypothetical protein
MNAYVRHSDDFVVLVIDSILLPALIGHYQPKEEGLKESANSTGGSENELQTGGQSPLA